MGNEGRWARFLGRKDRFQKNDPQQEILLRAEERKKTVRYNYQLHDDAATRLEDMDLPAEVMEDISTILRTGMAVSKDLSDMVWETVLREYVIKPAVINKIAERKSEIETEILLDLDSDMRT